jgi:uncharacterized protein (DUF302 family)
MNDNGLISLASSHSVPETIDRLVSIITTRGMIVFARVDHGANAAHVDMELRPTLLVLFGHPRGGTPLMRARQTIGIDLPVKALAWRDEEGRVWLTYEDLEWLARRHGIDPAIVAPLGETVATVAREAAAAE